MRSLEEFGKKAPAARDDITRAIKAVESSLSCRQTAPSANELVVQWSNFASPNLLAVIHGFSLPSSATTFAHFRSVYLTLHSKDVAVEDVTGRSITYFVELGKRGAWFRPEGVKMDPEPFGFEDNIVNLYGVGLANEGSSLFGPDELGSLTPERISTRCEAFANMVERAIATTG